MNTNSNNNSAAQTLFRFTSLRNPQLAESKSNDNFIERNLVTLGYFDALVEEWLAPPAKGLSKINYFLQKLSENPDVTTIKKTEKELILILGAFYDAGKKLTQKRNWDDITDIKQLMADLKIKVETSGSVESKLLNPASEGIKTLWDTLIYQMLTQEDFYIKEIIIQSMQVINYYVKYPEIDKELSNNIFTKHQQISSAKVVIPNFLFIDSATKQDEAVIFTINETRIGDSFIFEVPEELVSGIDYEARSAKMKQEIILRKRDQLGGLREELQKEHSIYQKLYDKSYSSAFGQHQSAVVSLVQGYEKAIEAVEATFTPEMTDEEKQEAINQVPKPSIPEFEFQYDVDFEAVTKKLSKDAFNTFTKLFGAIDPEVNKSLRGISDSNAPVTFSKEDYPTYTEIFEKIDDNLSLVNKDIIGKPNMEKEEFVKLGSVMVPVNGATAVPFSYSFMGKSTFFSYDVERTNYTWDFYLTIDLPDEEWRIKSINYKVRTLNGFIKIGTDYKQIKNGGQVLISDLFGQEYFYTVNSDVPVNIEFEISFTNGESTKIVIDRQIVSDLLYMGTFKVGEYNESGKNNVFVPNGFGIKRLGIADYMKVEQTLHAYVPGEVSNIENIMASELRHKSSSKLLRTEDTVTTATSTEVEHVSDTTTASRNEMQSEVSKILQQDKMTEGHTSYSKGGANMKFEVGGSFANHTSKEDATRQAVAKSQEITARAMDRVVSRVSEERVSKIIQEFTENNVHEFDNRGGNQHITGVYRWVDKKMKNQIFNYGKRMMLEFMIPQPAKLHQMAIGSIPGTTTYQKPVDPRTSKTNTMKDAVMATESVIGYWADEYNVKLTELPTRTMNVKQEQFYDKPNADGSTGPYTRLLSIPENYAGKSGIIDFILVRNSSFYNSNAYCNDLMGGQFDLSFGGKSHVNSRSFSNAYILNSHVFNYWGRNIESFDFNITITCELSDEFILSWKKEQFSKIIEAYDVAVKEWEEKMDAIKKEEEDEKTKEENIGYYRQIEEVILKHNCIAYLLQSYGKLGVKLYEGTEMKNFKILLGKDLDEYTALAKFMEQAFEWEIMSYNFYPYYWGSREDWKDMYMQSSTDPLFRSFLQAGMGRVIVTIKPGFEDAVNFYMATGKIWNGGEVPVIGDPLYLSIADELKEPQGEKYGKAWITRVPTTLTILQAKTVGLEVEEALPRTIENPQDFEIPEELVMESDFQLKDNLKLEGSDKESTLG